jgi:hypothetical protein
LKATSRGFTPTRLTAVVGLDRRPPNARCSRPDLAADQLKLGDRDVMVAYLVEVNAKDE